MKNKPLDMKVDGAVEALPWRTMQHPLHNYYIKCLCDLELTLKQSLLLQRLIRGGVHHGENADLKIRNVCTWLLCTPLLCLRVEILVLRWHKYS